MSRMKMKDGQLIPFTADEEAEADAREAAWLASEAARTATAARLAADTTEAAAVKVEAQVQTFLNMTPSELDQWCDSNLPAGGTRVMGKVLGRLAQSAARGQKLR